VMAIFPRSAEPSDSLRAPIRNTNRLLAIRYAGNPQVIYLDIGTRFLTADGSLPASVMPDGTHPSDAGYQLWASALIEAGVRRNSNPVVTGGGPPSGSSARPFTVGCDMAKPSHLRTSASYAAIRCS
jgi:hypothetical protein